MRFERRNLGNETWRRSGHSLRLCTAAMILGACFDVAAQHSIKRHIIGGGGGVGVAADPLNSSYRVSMTVGDPLSGSSQGGLYTLSAGFLGFPGGQEVPEDVPELIIIPHANEVVLSWRLPAAGWVLDRTSALAGASTIWTEVSAPSRTDGTHVSVTVPMHAENTFFRLRKP